MKTFTRFAEAYLAPQLAMPDVIANALRDAIFAGVFESSEPLRQEEIAAQFGVSRIPVREASRSSRQKALSSTPATKVSGSLLCRKMTSSTSRIFGVFWKGGHWASQPRG